MLSFNLYIKPEYHNSVILDFINPLFEKHIRDEKIRCFIFKRYALDHSPHIRFFVYNLTDLFENEFIIACNLFFKNSPIFNSSSDNEIGNTIFLKYPQGHIEIDRESNSNIINENVLFRITNTSINIIRQIEEKKEEVDELQILALLVFIYALGGYSSNEIIKICNSLTPQLNFTEDDKANLNEQVDFILIENLLYLKKRFNIVLEELYTYNRDIYPSVISKWKYSFGMLGEKHTTLGQNKFEYFNLFRNQISLSDAESYCVLQIIAKGLTSD